MTLACAHALGDELSKPGIVVGAGRERRHDGRIAAAPDMLAALQRIVAELDTATLDDSALKNGQHTAFDAGRRQRRAGLSTEKAAKLAGQGDTSRYWRCASLPASSDRVEIEISVERDRDSGRMLPLARFQEGLFNQRRDFGLAHLDSDA
jgi:hypothetical protein